MVTEKMPRDLAGTSIQGCNSDFSPRVDKEEATTGDDNVNLWS